MKPSTKLKIRLLAVAVLIPIVSSAMWLLRPEPTIGPASYERIKLGMTEAEIEAVIGLPPGSYYGSADRKAESRTQKGVPTLPSSGYHRSAEWWGTQYGIIVAFDKSGAAVGCCLFDVRLTREPSGLLDHLRYWLGL